jgi:SAM-dependent methyltransferase
LESSDSAEPFPLCPVTGSPAVRRVQWVTARLLTDLWRIEFGVDTRPNFAGLERFGLWESPTGLYFFDPPCEGDHTFYAAFYENLRKRRLFTDNTLREEFRLAAKRIPPGAHVLDVGCGHGNFRQCVPDADYTGLDPHFALQSPVPGVRNESLEHHLRTHAGAYDAVCCFEVLEHVRDPRALFAGIVQAAKPGGLICIGVPHVPSVFTRIPNFLISAPPHHLTWWSKRALRDLARSAGADVESIDNVPWAADEAPLYWIERFSPIKCSDVHFRGDAKWHVAALVGYVLGMIAFRLVGPPKGTNDEGVGLLMIARKAAVA